jgi:serine/threonine protein kinase
MKNKHDSLLRNLDVKNINHIKEALELNNLIIIDSIGQGAFGSIYLLQSNEESYNYYVAKVQLIENVNDQEIEKVKQESNFTKLNNKDFIKVILEMRLKNGIISVIEWAEVGDMYSLMDNKRIPENIAFIIFYRICKAVKSLHKKMIIHRDIKLENILVKLNGEIKLCDLGLARKLKENEDEANISSSFVGSPLYLSPEIILGKKGLYCIDIWCLGIMLYILVYGYPPFKVNFLRINDNKEYINSIINKEVNYDNTNISEGCRELLKKILNKKGKERIKLNEILNNNWIITNLKVYGTDDDDELRELMAIKFHEYMKSNSVFK